MEHGEHLYMIGLGSQADWEAGRGAIYYVTDENGEKGLPVFSTTEGATSYGQANFNTPDAHMDMLESVPAPHADLLTAGRYIIVPVEADYLIRDPRPGDVQEVIRRPGTGL